MSGRLTFHAWLMAQRDRADPVGDLARDARADRDWPARGRTPNDFRRYLDHRNACDGALRALDRAWREYRTDNDAAAEAAGRSTP
jgi:uncharacterized protein YozE (UPF0346 family)